MDTIKLSFPAAMKHYFGARPGTKGTAQEFMEEYKQLTEEDKAEFRRLLPSVGYEITN